MAGPNDIGEAIWRVLKRQSPVLFAGAGVGKWIDLPDWRQYMDVLASICERWGDKTSATLLKEKVARNQFLSAGTIYKSCDLIPEGERWKELAAPFVAKLSDKQIDRLIPLVTLPFTSIVTTNYDHSLHETCVHARKWFVPVERGDGTLRGAVFQRDFSIVRLHGRVELPQSMAMTTEDYAALSSESDYLDFLLELFRSRSCLFVGFSFVDPAIDLILKLYAAKYGPTYQALHTALIPEQATDLAARLRAVNIEVIPYASGHEHVDLWSGIRVAHDQITQRRNGPATVVATNTTSIRRFIAFAYAQIHVSREQRRGIATAIVDGLVLSVLAPNPEKAKTVAELASEIATVLRIDEEEAKSLVVASVEKLAAKEQVLRVDDDVLLLKQPPLLLEEHLLALSQHVVDRVHVREGIKLPNDDFAGITAVLEGLLMARAWDVAAHYAGAGTGIGPDVRQTVHVLVEEQRSKGRLSAAQSVEHAILSLLHAPEDREAAMLSQLARAAFGLQLVLATPRQVLFQRFSLPQRIYLDASVLMPAIAEGHPLQPVYMNALRRLEEAARAVDVTLEVVVGEQFLNEIVSHRRKALDVAAQLDLDDAHKLQQFIDFHTAQNSNVFIAGYAAWLMQHEGRLFSDYLKATAPYETEDQLAQFLKERLAIHTKKMFAEEHGGVFGEVFSDLLSGYESSARFFEQAVKDKRLVQHEAQQLTQLRIDHDEGMRSVFVTADERLRRLVYRLERLHAFSGAIISQLGLVALVDVMVGLDVDTRSWVKLVWAVPQGSDEEALVEYFVRLGVSRYQEGMAVEMQEAARQVATQMVEEAKAKKIPLFGVSSMRDEALKVKFLERYENEFFKNWSDAIDHRERQRQQSDRKH